MPRQKSSGQLSTLTNCPITKIFVRIVSVISTKSRANVARANVTRMNDAGQILSGYRSCHLLMMYHTHGLTLLINFSVCHFVCFYFSKFQLLGNFQTKDDDEMLHGSCKYHLKLKMASKMETTQKMKTTLKVKTT